MPSPRLADGFSLLEALIAAALLAGAIATLATLIIRSVEQTVSVESDTILLTMAQAKLEQLRAARFAFTQNGGRVQDPELSLSPGDTLAADVPPYVEALGRYGEIVAPDEVPMYVRRWRVAPRANDPDTLTIAVCVVPRARVGAAPSQACVWTMRARRP